MPDYAQMLDDLVTYTTYESDEFLAARPTFVQAAEERIFYFVQLPFFQQNATSAFTAGIPYIQLPNDFLAADAFTVTDGSGEVSTLLNKDSNYIREVYPSASTQGLPRFYGLFNDTTAIVGPTPDDDYDVELSYYYRPASLVNADTSNTTWLSINAYNTLLYGALSEAANFLKKTQGIDDMGSTYEQRFVLGLQGLKNLGEARDQKDTYRSGTKRMPE